MWEYVIGKCKTCKVPILVDEEYKVVGDLFNKQYTCKHCLMEENRKMTLEMIYQQSLDVIRRLSNDVHELKEKLRDKEILDKNVKVIVKDQARKVKHLFPLENTPGYGQLCGMLLMFEKALNEIKDTYNLPNYNKEVMIDMDDIAKAMYLIAEKATKL